MTGIYFAVISLVLYERLCPSVSPLVCWSIGRLVRRSVGPSVHRVGPSDRENRFEKWGIAYFWCCSWVLCLWLCIRWARVLMGVVCPCPPVRNDIVTLCHLFLNDSTNFTVRALYLQNRNILNKQLLSIFCSVLISCCRLYEGYASLSVSCPSLFPLFRERVRGI